MFPEKARGFRSELLHLSYLHYSSYLNSVEMTVYLEKKKKIFRSSGVCIRMILIDNDEIN